MKFKIIFLTVPIHSILLTNRPPLCFRPEPDEGLGIGLGWLIIQACKLERNRALFKDELSTMQGAKLYASGSGMFAVLGVSPVILHGALLETERVSVLPCDGFGESGRGLVRISLCDNEALIREAARRIMNQVSSY